MHLNLANIEHKDYKVDFKRLEIFLNYLSQIQKFSLENQLFYSVIGHLSLILLSNKIYRNPDDIDILILFKDLNTWLEYLKQEWEWFGSVENINILHMLIRNELQKFASININKCAINEKDADLFKIENNNFYLHLDSKVDNYIDKKIIAQPEFVYHNPNKKTHENTDFIEFKNDKFKIWFYTNSLAQHFKSYIIFYDKNLAHKEVIECYFDHDYIKDNQTYAYWVSQEIDLNKFNGCYYRIFVQKELFATRLQHPNTKILLECYICKNICDLYKVPITYIDKHGPLNNLKILFNNLPLIVQYPYRALNNKYGRQKDLDDYEVYKYLMEEYPLTNFSK